METKLTANEIFGIFEKFKKGECSYDRALQDASTIINNYSDQRSIVGYVKSGLLKKIFLDIFTNKKENEKQSYIFDCRIHQNEMNDIERMLKSIVK